MDVQWQLSRPCLSRITAYLKVKIWFLPKHENLTIGKKYCGKEEKLLLRSSSSSFPQYFQNISNFKSPNRYIFVKCGCLNYFFLNSANLICRGMDISKYFRESLGIRDNESTEFTLYYANKHNYCFAFFGGKDQTFISSVIYDKSMCQMFALLGPFLTKGHKLNKIIHSFV